MKRFLPQFAVLVFIFPVFLFSQDSTAQAENNPCSTPEFLDLEAMVMSGRASKYDTREYYKIKNRCTGNASERTVLAVPEKKSGHNSLASIIEIAGGLIGIGITISDATRTEELIGADSTKIEIGNNWTATHAIAITVSFGLLARGINNIFN